MSGPFKMKGWSPFTKASPVEELEYSKYGMPVGLAKQPLKPEPEPTGMRRTYKKLKPKKTNIVQSFIDFAKSKKK